MILIIRTPATPEQRSQMLEELKFYIRLAVDIERRILAGGAQMHYLCEQALLEDGSSQKNIWGAGFMPVNQKITYDSLINIRPRQNNRSMEILDFVAQKLAVKGTRITISAIPIDLAVAYWLYLASKSWEPAIVLVRAISNSKKGKDNPFSDYSGMKVCLPNTKRRNVSFSREKLCQLALAEELSGETEVVTPVGEIDILTVTEIIEVKPAKHWKSALGQILAYGHFYPSHQKRIHLIGCVHSQVKKNLEDICANYQVVVSWE